MDASGAFRVVRSASEKAGVPWVGLHSLRHTCATMLFRHGLNAKQVQAWLGHHKASFTLDTYVHLLDGDLPDAAFLDALLPSGDLDRVRGVGSADADTSDDSDVTAVKEPPIARGCVKKTDWFGHIVLCEANHGGNRCRRYRER